MGIKLRLYCCSYSQSHTNLDIWHTLNNHEKSWHDTNLSKWVFRTKGFCSTKSKIHEKYRKQINNTSEHQIIQNCNHISLTFQSRDCRRITLLHFGLNTCRNIYDLWNAWCREWIPQLGHVISPFMLGFQLLFFAILFKSRLYSEIYRGCGCIGIDFLSRYHWMTNLTCRVSNCIWPHIIDSLLARILCGIFSPWPENCCTV